ncbi:MAG: hypothetical protein ACJ74Y_16825 [Bryobacteraceae bacterium]
MALIPGAKLPSEMAEETLLVYQPIPSAGTISSLQRNEKLCLQAHVYGGTDTAGIPGLRGPCCVFDPPD